MYYGKINEHDIANGTGVRVSLFVSGCTHHCPGCFNECAWDFKYGEYFTWKEKYRIIELLKPDHIDGLTILGGEPLDPQNLFEVCSIVRDVRGVYDKRKTIWIYSGYTFEELAGRGDYYTQNILELVDVLVDGRFIEAEADVSLPFRGSRNQRIIDVRKSLKKGAAVLLSGKGVPRVEKQPESPKPKKPIHRMTEREKQEAEERKRITEERYEAARLALRERIAQLVEGSGLEKHDVARKFGVSRTVLYAYFRGVNVPGVQTLLKAAECFGVTVGWMLGEREDTGEVPELRPETDRVEFTKQVLQKRLRQLIDERGVTQYAVARDIGVSEHTVCNMMTGYTLPFVHTLIALSEYFGVSVDWLLGMEG